MPSQAAPETLDIRALLTVLAPLVLPGTAGAVTGNFFAGDPIDGPGPDVQSLVRARQSSVAAARDGRCPHSRPRTRSD